MKSMAVKKALKIGENKKTWQKKAIVVEDLGKIVLAAIFLLVIAALIFLFFREKMIELGKNILGL